MKQFVSLFTLALLLTVSGAALAQDNVTAQLEDICAANLPAEDPESREFAEAADVLETGTDYRAVMCTGAGPVYIDLYEDLTPETVNNFVFLAQQGYYNNTTFHRVIEDFMAQAGDPTGTGSGGPGYQFADEFVNYLTFDQPGLLAMANAGPGTNGSQFFITTAETPWLNFAHTIFGDVLVGYDNVTSIDLRDPQTATDPGTALETVVVLSGDEIIAVEEDASEPASAEDIDTALSVLTAPDALPADLVVTEASGITPAGDVVATLPEDVQADAETFFETYNHQFRVELGINNETCSDQYFFDSLSYMVDAFASADDAAAALEDGFLTALAETQGFTLSDDESLTLPVYTQDVTTCADLPGVQARTYLQRGRYIATVDAFVAEDILGQVTPDLLLNEAVARIFEQTLGGIYRAEIR